MTFFLVYVSSASTLFSRAELDEILRTSRRNNERLGVSGALLYKGGNLMQVLESRMDALVLGPDGRELAAATNRREADGDPFAHAEVIALREAARVLGDGWRLEDCTLVVTLEPCTMCAGAAVAARVGRIVFGAWEPRTGACGSLWDVVRDRRLVHRPEVRGGVLEDECAAVLEGFFRARR